MQVKKTKLAFPKKINKIAPMLNRKTTVIFAFLLGILGLEIAFAQSETPELETQNIELAAEVEPELEVEFEPEIIEPQISADKFVPLRTKTLFSAENSKLVSPSTYGRASFSWDFGDGSRPKWGQQILHEFEIPGTYPVKLTIKQGKKREFLEQPVVVFDQKGVLISDKLDDFEGVILQAGQQGIWLEKIILDPASSGFSAESTLNQRIGEIFDFLRDADLVLLDTENLEPIQNLAQYWQKLSPENQFNAAEKLWVQISETSMEKNAKLLEPIFKILSPEFILLTRPSAINPIFELQKNPSTLLATLQQREIEHEIIDQRERVSLLPFSRLMTFFVVNGVSQNVIYLLLAVPFLTFVISFFRQFIGISTFGVFAPLMLSLSFLVLGLGFGMIVFLVVMLVSWIIRVLFEKVDLLYIPKISLLISLLALSFFLVLALAVFFEVSLNLSLTIFPMLVMATISEKFIASQSESGLKMAFLAAAETVLVALAGYFLINAEFMRSAILAFPEWILVPILATIWLGKFTGLRVSEYFKFRSLLSEDSQE